MRIVFSLNTGRLLRFKPRRLKDPSQQRMPRILRKLYPGERTLADHQRNLLMSKYKYRDHQ